MYPTRCLVSSATSCCNSRVAFGAGCSGRVLSDHAFLATRVTAFRTSTRRDKLPQGSYNLANTLENGRFPGSLRISICKDRSSHSCQAKRRSKGATDVDEAEGKVQLPASGKLRERHADLLGTHTLCVTFDEIVDSVLMQLHNSSQACKASDSVEMQIHKTFTKACTAHHYLLQIKQAAQQVWKACSALSHPQQHLQLLSQSQLYIAAAQDPLIRRCCKNGRRCLSAASTHPAASTPCI